MTSINPYTFLPFQPSAPSEGQHGRELPSAISGNRNHHARHDRFSDELLTGSLQVEISLKTPTFVGSGRHRENSKAPLKVQHYKVPSPDGSAVKDAPPRLAIPASSLRGMVSTTHEVLTRSAMRVAEDLHLSHRAPARDGLSSLGIVVKRPSLGNEPVRILIFPLWISQEEAARLKLSQSKRHGNILLERACLRRVAYWANPPKGDKALCTNGPVVGPGQMSKYLSPWKTKGPVRWDASSKPAGHTEAVPGFVRALGWREPENLVAKSKKHELFIPWTAEDGAAWAAVAKEDGGSDGGLLHVADSALVTFDVLSSEGYLKTHSLPGSQQLPLHPAGTREDHERMGKKSDVQSRKLQLRTGDIVYMRCELAGSDLIVSEVSFSSIWRKVPRGPDGTGSPTGAHDFFRSVDPELVPWSSGRSQLTPTELLFGFVSQDSRDSTGGPTAWKGRLVFTDALCTTTLTPCGNESQPWRELASPKPPSIPFYFRPKKGIPVDSNYAGGGLHPKLSIGYHEPRGRKVYWHHESSRLNMAEKSAAASLWPWHSRLSAENAKKAGKRQLIAKPIKPGAGREYAFVVHFHRITPAELGSLVLALCPSLGVPGPNDAWHRLGAGKPLGLGSVRLAINKLTLLKAPSERFSVESLASLDARGLFDSWGLTGPEPVLQSKLQSYCKIALGAGGSPGIVCRNGLNSLLRAMHPRAVLGADDGESRKGNPIRYPVVESGNADPTKLELNLYDWFVDNGHGSCKGGDRNGNCTFKHRWLPELEDPNQGL